MPVEKENSLLGNVLAGGCGIGNCSSAEGFDAAGAAMLKSPVVPKLPPPEARVDIPLLVVMLTCMLVSTGTESDGPSYTLGKKTMKA